MLLALSIFLVLKTESYFPLLFIALSGPWSMLAGRWYAHLLARKCESASFLTAMIAYSLLKVSTFMGIKQGFLAPRTALLKLKLLRLVGFTSSELFPIIIQTVPTLILLLTLRASSGISASLALLFALVFLFLTSEFINECAMWYWKIAILPKIQEKYNIEPWLIPFSFDISSKEKLLHAYGRFYEVGQRHANQGE